MNRIKSQRRRPEPARESEWGPVRADAINSVTIPSRPVAPRSASAPTYEGITRGRAASVDQRRRPARLVRDVSQAVVRPMTDRTYDHGHDQKKRVETEFERVDRPGGHPPRAPANAAFQRRNASGKTSGSTIKAVNATSPAGARCFRPGPAGPRRALGWWRLSLSQNLSLCGIDQTSPASAIRSVARSRTPAMSVADSDGLTRVSRAGTPSGAGAPVSYRVLEVGLGEVGLGLAREQERDQLDWRRPDSGRWQASRSPMASPASRHRADRRSGSGR